MKTLNRCSWIGLVLANCCASEAGIYHFTQSDGQYSVGLSGLAQTIPDNNPSGVSYALNFSDPAVNSIASISVSFQINGGWNGDLYAYLSHGDGFVVLLNRVGRSELNAAGSPGTGFSSFTLGSSYATDIHGVTGTYGQATTGNYAPDGRNIVPSSTGIQFDQASRSATFSTLTGMNPNGDWTLFFSDMGALNASELNSWSVNITPVPEPVTGALAVSGVIFGAASVGRWWLNRRRARLIP